MAMVVYVSVVELTVVVFLDVVSSDKYLENIRRAVRNLSNTTKPKTTSLTRSTPLLFLQETQLHVQFKKAECSIIRGIILLLSKIYYGLVLQDRYYKYLITKIGNINLAPNLLEIYGSGVLLCGLLSLEQMINLMP
jgi:hypothetical protein